jgi:hypothetical protein
LERPYLEKPYHEKNKRAGRVAQSVGSEFNPSPTLPHPKKEKK